jgi:hypothetical protein
MQFSPVIEVMYVTEPEFLRFDNAEESCKIGIVIDMRRRGEAEVRSDAWALCEQRKGAGF